MPSEKLIRVAAFFWLLLSMESAAQAYLGPGAGLGAIGAMLGLIGSIFLGIFAFIWYPMKRAWKALARRSAPPQDTDKLDG
jgi:hypothetical protein